MKLRRGWGAHFQEGVFCGWMEFAYEWQAASGDRG